MSKGVPVSTVVVPDRYMSRDIHAKATQTFPFLHKDSVPIIRCHFFFRSPFCNHGPLLFLANVSSLIMLPPPKATLLLLFVHGFKGHDHHTFLDFPTRIMTIFTNAKANLDVESIVYPQYDTRGDFNVPCPVFLADAQYLFSFVLFGDGIAE